MNYSEEMTRVTESSTCLTSAQALFDSSWHLETSWINPGWNCCSLTERQELTLSRWNTNRLYSGILVLNRDTNPSTNKALHYMVTLLFRDNGETIKQLVQESRTIPWQGVHALWLAGIMLSMEDHPLIPLAICVHYWIFNLWFTGLQWGLVCLWIRDKISE